MRRIDRDTRFLLDRRSDGGVCALALVAASAERLSVVGPESSSARMLWPAEVIRQMDARHPGAER